MAIKSHSFNEALIRGRVSANVSFVMSIANVRVDVDAGVDAGVDVDPVVVVVIKLDLAQRIVGLDGLVLLRPTLMLTLTLTLMLMLMLMLREDDKRQAVCSNRMQWRLMMVDHFNGSSYDI